MSAREVELGDAVVAMLTAGMPTRPPKATPETIMRSDIPVEELAGFDERRIYVFVAGYSDVARIARKRTIAEAPTAVLFAELFKDPASAEPTGPIPAVWTDERRATVAELYKLLNETGVFKAKRLLGTFWPETCTLSTPVDLGRLDQQKVFWSLIEVGYREFRRE